METSLGFPARIEAAAARSASSVVVILACGGEVGGEMLFFPYPPLSWRDQAVAHEN